jgi:hypothetical protein
VWVTAYLAPLFATCKYSRRIVITKKLFIKLIKLEEVLEDDRNKEN